MKTAALLFSVILIGSSTASEITYTQTITTQPGSGFAPLSGSVPLFDVSRPDIPDMATLEWVRVEVTQIIVAGLTISGAPGLAVVAAPVLTSVFQSPSLRALTDSETFSSSGEIPAGGSLVFSYSPTLQMLSSTDDNRRNFTPAFSGGATEAWITGSTTFDGIVSSIQTTYSVTYTYGVPDGGSTLPLMLAGLVSCRLIASRRWTRNRL